MATFTPVLERVSASVVPAFPWPVTAQEERWLRVHAEMRPDEVGMALYSLAFHTKEGDDKPVTADAALKVLTSNEDLYAPGGLLVEDRATGVRVEPGCCCDLFEWRDWLNALDGRCVSVGHEPAAPRVEHIGDVVRVWANEDDPAQGHVDFLRDQLLDLLRPARKAMLGFLAAVRMWSLEHLPGQADRLVTAVDAGLSVSAPLS